MKKFILLFFLFSKLSYSQELINSIDINLDKIKSFYRIEDPYNNEYALILKNKENIELIKTDKSFNILSRFEHTIIDKSGDFIGNSTKENVNYSGCGNYIVDYRLFDLWLLEEIDGKKVSLDDFNKEMPSIEINSSEKKFFGQGGCNRISGNIFQERELLRFTNIISTRMACGEINKENSFLNALQSSTEYKIKNNRLYLTNSDGVKVVFKKID